MVNVVDIKHDVVDDHENVVWVDLAILVEFNGNMSVGDGNVGMILEPLDVFKIVNACTEYVNRLSREYRKTVMYRWAKPRKGVENADGEV